MSRIIVFVSGGNVQSVIADEPGHELMLIDYDNEQESGKDLRRFEPIDCNTRVFHSIVHGIEQDAHRRPQSVNDSVGELN